MNSCRLFQSEYPPINNNRISRYARQNGVSLIVSLILLVVISMLGISGAQIAIQEEKASRSDGDRQMAFHAAEAALVDAELDIERSPDAAKSRSDIFSKNSAIGFPDESEPGCVGGDGNVYLGLCSAATGEAVPVWVTANLIGEASSVINSVAYGTFTGRSFQTGKGALPYRLPRYVIELMPFQQDGESSEQVNYVYRITAIGFGTKDATKVVLQAIYRKES